MVLTKVTTGIGRRRKMYYLMYYPAMILSFAGTALGATAIIA